MKGALPVHEVLAEVVQALASERRCVLVAPTGAGKTTAVPPALDDAGLGPVVVLEPRRLAARAAARRVAAERGARLGEAIGYHVRFDRRAGPRTRVTYATEGVFVRRLQDDPFLEGTGCVVLDEFHERSLDLDLSLALVRRVQLEARPELGLLVTSATLDAEAVARYLDGAPIVRSAGRLFPVGVRHLPPLAGERADAHVARGVREALAEAGGDVLVFLPGTGEIRRARAALEPLARGGALELVELYGDLPPEEQYRALAPGAVRGVVLATNVAESSVTVPGVDAVVDSGLVRRPRSDPALGLERLAVERVSQASAEQRAGRAGRERPGRCLRLWSAADERALAPFDPPEVRRADPSAAVLQLLLWGERDLERFPWFEPPPPEALRRALALVRALGALDAAGALTPLGRRLARVPAPPRLARLLLEGARAGLAERAALACAFLGERDPRRRARDAGASRSGGESDVLDGVLALEAFAAHGASAAPELEPAAARACLAAARQLERVAHDLGREEGARARSADPDLALLRALLAAFPDRLARRRADDPRRGVLASGRGVRLGPGCAVERGELFLAVDAEAGAGEALVRLASRVERGWVDGGRTRAEIDCVFDQARARVVGRRRLFLGELVLEENETSADDAARAEALLAEAARREPARALGLERPEVVALLARVAFLRRHCPELALPALDEAALAELAGELVVGRRSFEELARAPLAELLRARLPHEALRALEREAPERLEVPSGSWLRLDYAGGGAPVLAARIQELFGWRETPRVARGRVPVLLHLLAPSGRPQQVTDDLASFWRGAYFDVRKDLRRRYPRHDWPEDPLSAVASRGPRRRS